MPRDNMTLTIHVDTRLLNAAVSPCLFVVRITRSERVARAVLWAINLALPWLVRIKVAR